MTQEQLEQERAEVEESLQVWEKRLYLAQEELRKAAQEIYAHRWHLGRLAIMQQATAVKEDETATNDV